MAYAAVVSLSQILNQLLRGAADDPFPNTSTVTVLQIHSKPLIESLLEKLSSLRSSLKKLFPVPKSSWSTTDDLETKIRDTIYKAQDAVEYLIQSHSENSSKPDGNPTLLLFLQETIANIDSITKTADEIQVSIEEAAERRDFLSETNALPDSKISDDEIIVGQDEYLEKLKGMVLDDTPHLKFLSIVGMPGIGKTTLAKRIYNDPLMQLHFSTRLWVTISHDCRAGDVLLSLVGGAYKNKFDLVLRLHQRLFSARYLVVLDNIWDNEVWHSLRRALPDENNGCRVILTTPNADLVNWNAVRDPFLNEDASWELLRRVVFEKLYCPSQLEIIGRKIAKNCEGLPLAIIEVGKLLRGTEPTVANWKAVEENENPLIIGANDDTPLSKALTPSYKSLPLNLKALFLYMGLLPRNTMIRASKLIQLWVSEGFVDSEESDLSLETTAMMHLSDLVTRSLVIARKHSSWGLTMTCGMHFVFRGLCISEARKEDFFEIIKKLDDDGIPQGTRINTKQQRICFHNNIVLGFKQVHESMDSIPSARSLFCFGPHHQYPVKVHFPFKLLRVLDSLALRFYMFPNEVFELVRLRYLAITYDGELPPSISILLDLEVLVVRRHHQIIKSSDDPVDYLPIEIWKLHKLKHLHCMGSDLLDPSTKGLYHFVSLRNLLTLSGVSGHSCVRGVLSRMPNLTKIGIRVVVQSTTTQIDTPFSFFGNFTESLFDHSFGMFKCVVLNPSLGVVVSPSISPSFSVNISKISLSGCGFAWESMRAIAVMPYLVELKLRCYAFRGPVWEIDPKSEFLSLNFLLLEDLDIECLNGCFPELRGLTIRHCYKLLEIDPHLSHPSDLWKIQLIEVDDCSPATEIWARHILGETKKKGGLKVKIHSSRDDIDKNKPK